MRLPGHAPAWLQDLPVCFPGHPCVDYSPYEADAIDLTSALTPASAAIAIGCFVVLGAGVLAIAIGLRAGGRRPRLWVVALSLGLVLIGGLVASLARLRLDAIVVIFGLEGPGGPELFGSWPLVEAAGWAMTGAGVGGLALTATIAVVVLRGLTTRRATRGPA